KLLGFTLIGAEWVLWLLLFLSVLSIGIILERFFFFAITSTNFPNLSKDLSSYLHDKKYEEALSLCESGNSIEEKVATVGILNRDMDIKVIESSMQSVVVEQRVKLDRGLVVLGTLGNNAPFIGLFGTVIGIIKAFNDLALNPAGGASVVMSGISEALVATAVGLFVAIPAVIAFNTFNRKVKKHLQNSEAIIKLISSQIKI
ncbi:MAG: flagellar motor protein MotA, partial [Zetaproteobacteria bacterium]|nr:flagellar motor protein MotA [Pseudobdellovibrionaceae bacterium]